MSFFQLMKGTELAMTVVSKETKNTMNNSQHNTLRQRETVILKRHFLLKRSRHRNLSLLGKANMQSKPEI